MHEYKTVTKVWASLHLFFSSASPPPLSPCSTKLYVLEQRHSRLSHCATTWGGMLVTRRLPRLLAGIKAGMAAGDDTPSIGLGFHLQVCDKLSLATLRCKISCYLPKQVHKVLNRKCVLKYHLTKHVFFLERAVWSGSTPLPCLPRGGRMLPSLG